MNSCHLYEDGKDTAGNPIYRVKCFCGTTGRQRLNELNITTCVHNWVKCGEDWEEDIGVEHCTLCGQHRNNLLNQSSNKGGSNMSKTNSTSNKNHISQDRNMVIHSNVDDDIDKVLAKIYTDPHEGRNRKAITTLIEQAERRAIVKGQKAAYSLGFGAAKKVYSYKLVPRSRVTEAYRDIITAYIQTTGEKDSIFLDYLNDCATKELEETK